MAKEKPARLQLLAEDADDLAVISATLQDAVAKVGDITFEPAAQRLTVAFNRYRWEAQGAERVRCALQIGSVTGVQTRRIRRDAKQAVVELLSISFEAEEAPGGVITFAFAGGGDMRVQVECVDAVLADLSQPWATSRTPAHDA
jgi:hypothetical protein